jgi:hypothetical protein
MGDVNKGKLGNEEFTVIEVRKIGNELKKNINLEKRKAQMKNSVCLLMVFDKQKVT